MNRKELIEDIAKEHKGMPKTQIDGVLKSFENNIVKAVKKGDDVKLTGFMTIGKKKRSARNGVNPSTGEKIKIKAKTVPYAKCGQTFKTAISGKKK